MKRCFRCNEEKPYLSYEIVKNSKDGYKASCRECLPPKYKRKLSEPVLDLDGEIWKDIIGYEGIYKVSNKSRIKSIERPLYRVGVQTHIKHEGLLKPIKHHNGYWIVNLTKNRISKSKEMHSIIAKVFIPNPENKSDVNHINNDRGDNRLENLEWCTQRENISHGNSFRNKKHSKYVGVSYNKNSNKWIAYIGIDKKLIRLGSTFENEIDAARKYNEKLLEMGIENKYNNELL